MRFDVDPAGAKEHECECCGNTSHTVWGYVYEGSTGTTRAARAVYYAGWVEDHDDRLISITIGLEIWGEGATAADRRSFGIDVRSIDGTPEMMVTGHPFVDEPNLLGRLLQRQEALADPSIGDLWQVADAIVTADPRVVAAMDWLVAG